MLAMRIVAFRVEFPLAAANILGCEQFSEEQLRRLPPSHTASHQLSCHPEARAFCGTKNLCNLPTLRRSQQVTQVLRFAQDDKLRLGNYSTTRRSLASWMHESAWRPAPRSDFCRVFSRSEPRL